MVILIIAILIAMLTPVFLAATTAVSVNFAISPSQIVLAGLSKSGACFYVLDDANAGTKYAKLPSACGCAALGAPLPPDPAWKANW